MSSGTLMRASSTAPTIPKLGHHWSMRSCLLVAVVALLVPADAPTATGSGLWTIVFVRNSREAARVTTRRDGFYRITLRPGVYNVRTLKKISIGNALEPSSVTVRSGRWTRVDFFIDTGIR
jgi:hypothetical protein